MKLVVGLGNPGQKYTGTRHNVGFEVVEELSRRGNARRPKAKFNGELAEASICGENTLLVRPLTFMNLSGQCVRAIVDFYSLELRDLLIICDDVNLPVGRIRVRPTGSAGGQNGLKDIIQRLETEDFARLRMGIGQAPTDWTVSNHVLSKFTAEERDVIDQSIDRAADAAESWIGHGMRQTMNIFNTDPAVAGDRKSGPASRSGIDPPADESDPKKKPD